MKLTEVQIQEILEAAKDAIIEGKPKRISIFHDDHVYAVFHSDGTTEVFRPKPDGTFDGLEKPLGLNEPVVDVTMMFGSAMDGKALEDIVGVLDHYRYKPYQSYDAGDLVSVGGNQSGYLAAKAIQSGDYGTIQIDDYGVQAWSPDLVDGEAPKPKN